MDQLLYKNTNILRLEVFNREGSSIHPIFGLSVCRSLNNEFQGVKKVVKLLQM